MWRMKQKACPKNDSNYAFAKMDENGDLITEKSELKNLYTKVYRLRLKHRDIRPNYSQLKELKNGLFEISLRLAKLRKSENWSYSDIIKVTKNLKTQKAAYPLGFELFKPGVAGNDLVRSLLMLCNDMKSQCDIPAFLEITNITSILKNR